MKRVPLALSVAASVFTAAWSAKAAATPADEAQVGWIPGVAEALSVCWEQPGPSEAKAWVQDTIEREYNAKTILHFIGWTDCAETPGAHVHIGVLDVPTHTKAVGQGLEQLRNGVVLNFTFKNWNRGCQQRRQQCIEGLALHEFGHVAGLPDVLIPFQNDPLTCAGKSISHAPAVGSLLDESSIMNYCNPDWQQAVLSPTDVAAVARIYQRG